jgi:hypothetical protein
VKTTIEIPDALLTSAKRYAAAHGLTLRQVLETGLRQVLASEHASSKAYRYKRATFGGKGLAEDQSWAELRDRIYEGRGA